jgi:hypothetical protein
MNTDIIFVPQGEKATRASNSCTACKSGHRRCDKVQPKCGRCKKTNKICSFEIQNESRTPVRYEPYPTVQIESRRPVNIENNFLHILMRMLLGEREQTVIREAYKVLNGYTGPLTSKPDEIAMALGCDGAVFKFQSGDKAVYGNHVAKCKEFLLSMIDNSATNLMTIHALITMAIAHLHEDTDKTLFYSGVALLSIENAKKKILTILTKQDGLRHLLLTMLELIARSIKFLIHNFTPSDPLLITKLLKIHFSFFSMQSKAQALIGKQDSEFLLSMAETALEVEFYTSGITENPMDVQSEQEYLNSIMQQLSFSLPESSCFYLKLLTNGAQIECSKLIGTEEAQKKAIAASDEIANIVAQRDHTQFLYLAIIPIALAAGIQVTRLREAYNISALNNLKVLKAIMEDNKWPVKSKFEGLVNTISEAIQQSDCTHEHIPQDTSDSFDLLIAQLLNDDNVTSLFL